jgi:Domain of unknown function (DUF4062)
MTKKTFKVMLSSTVFHFKSEIEQIYATLTGYGYEVLCSHMGTVYSVPGKSPEESCLIAVEDCDFFFGIILPHYGSGITHKEFTRAIERNIPRGYLVHSNVTFSKQLLKQFMYDTDGKRNGFALKKKTPVMDDLRVIDMYNEAIGDGKPLSKRLWAQEFYRYTQDGAPFVAKQFEDIERLTNDINKLKDE